MNQTTSWPQPNNHVEPAKDTTLWKVIIGIGLLAVVGFAGGAASKGADIVSPILAIAIVVAAVAAYFLPTMIAGSRKHHNVGAVAVVNLFLGWTFIGWVVALAMAATAVRPQHLTSMTTPAGPR
jgi:hypothetical protein